MKLEQPGNEGRDPRDYGMVDGEMPVYQDGVLIGFCTAFGEGPRIHQRITLGPDENEDELPGFRCWR